MPTTINGEHILKHPDVNATGDANRPRGLGMSAAQARAIRAARAARVRSIRRDLARMGVATAVVPGTGQVYVIAGHRADA